MFALKKRMWSPGAPSWNWPVWVPRSSAFVYFDPSAYPVSMDNCMKTYLPVCTTRQGDGFEACTTAVFDMCKAQALNVSSVSQPYPGA